MTSLAHHQQIVVAYKEHGEVRAAKKLGWRVSTVLYHVTERCACLTQNGPSAPPEPRCCKARCGMTLREHEVAPPRAGTWHERVWRAQAGRR